ncbi:acyltransferase ChoActase/COT/CPT [Dacryopinax primogenitus]|uniref:Acyltransferase ChoActase/COT/CPT n=1 Tax=Dacryopinax primogenitus (strain DJM 731) TaxID=1858805 RepID=M5G3Y1_DACPD|nr:acyltransferase ChoActase/COT/CPT [Dacryopinax primogenitus]EJU04961.1 acyltransferase ChoActase/COT/CPT [Dacryopinax primogenitus]
MFALHPPPGQQRLPTFHHQRRLPRLPVPPIRQTLDKYLKSLEPLLEEGELNGQGNKLEESQKRVAWAVDFENGIGRELQERLIDVDRSSENNWLDDNFWIKKAYHEWRAPLMVHSNWWLLFHTDATIPLSVAENPPSPGQFGEWQLKRAAWLTARFLDFKAKVDQQEIHPDSSRTGPFDMYQYTRVFNLSRIPKPGCDMLSHKPALKDPGARSIMVMAKDWVYMVEVLDRDGGIVGIGEIEKRLGDLMADVENRVRKGEKAEPVCILSSDDRDVWANNREYLLTLSPVINRKAFTLMENSLFALCLDMHTIPTPSSSNFVPAPIEAHVRSIATGPDGLNRWYDKTLTVIVESSGRAGMMGEHSPCDALIPSIVVDYAIAEPIDLGAFTQNLESAEEGDVIFDADTTTGPKTRGWERVEFELDDKMRKEIQEATIRAKATVDDSDASQLWFDEYGADWIKKTAKQSPDAYIQMALQLAFYKDQGFFSATYETASTRLFAHGRTDVIRTYTTNSRTFVRAMLDPSASAEARYKALSTAIFSHNAYTREASTGKGIDRHLMGLRLMLRDKEGEGVKLFEDPLFAKSQEWKLSTSGLSEGTRFHGTGFGTVWPDGYGTNYLAGGDLIKFGVESKICAPNTNTQRFKRHLVDSLREMKQVCEEGAALPAKL